MDGLKRQAKSRRQRRKNGRLNRVQGRAAGERGSRPGVRNADLAPRFEQTLKSGDLRRNREKPKSRADVPGRERDHQNADPLPSFPEADAAGVELALGARADIADGERTGQREKRRERVNLPVGAGAKEQKAPEDEGVAVAVERRVENAAESVRLSGNPRDCTVHQIEQAGSEEGGGGFEKFPFVRKPPGQCGERQAEKRQRIGREAQIAKQSGESSFKTGIGHARKNSTGWRRPPPEPACRQAGFGRPSACPAVEVLVHYPLRRTFSRV